MDSSLKPCASSNSAGNSGEPAGPSQKTSPDSSAATTEPTLRQWLEKWLEPSSLYQKQNGKTPEWLLDPEDSSVGQFWMRNGSEFRRGAVASSLSEILETGEVDRRYFLSAKACKGILRRAEKRGKALPPSLRDALLGGGLGTDFRDCDGRTCRIHSKRMFLGRKPDNSDLSTLCSKKAR